VSVSSQGNVRDDRRWWLAERLRLLANEVEMNLKADAINRQLQEMRAEVEGWK
jgi:hypothetical protein